MKHVLLFIGLSSASLFGLAQNAPGAAGKASADGSAPNSTSDTTKVQELVLREVYVIPTHIGHAQQQIVLTPKMPAQHLPEVLEANAASLDLRSRGLNDVQTDLSVRGSTFDQVHVVVDGIPFTDPQTGHHSAILPIPIEAIQEIRVLPSGGSYRYGPFAFAGVVELRSLDARSGRGYSASPNCSIWVEAGPLLHGLRRSLAQYRLCHLAGILEGRTKF
jgi:outer membrane receptor protein involved in Fe transport